MIAFQCDMHFLPYIRTPGSKQVKKNINLMLLRALHKRKHKSGAGKKQHLLAKSYL